MEKKGNGEEQRDKGKGGKYMGKREKEKDKQGERGNGKQEKGQMTHAAVLIKQIIVVK